MKFLMVIGGFAGFVISMGLGIAQSNDWSTILVRSAATALVIGWLFRWWGKMWLQQAAVAQLKKAQEEAAAQQSQKTTNQPVRKQ